MTATVSSVPASPAGDLVALRERYRLTLRYAPEHGERFRGVPMRHYQVLLAAAHDLSVDETAAAMLLAPNTIREYRKRILKDMGCTSIGRAVVLAGWHGVLRGSDGLEGFARRVEDADGTASVTLDAELLGALVSLVGELQHTAARLAEVFAGIEVRTRELE